MAWREVIEDERNRLSSTRIVALAAAFTVILLALLDGVAEVTVDPTLVGALAGLSLGAFTKAAVDKRSPHAVVGAELHKARESKAMGAVPDTEG